VEHPIYRVVSFARCAPFTLRLLFDDGLEREIDFRPVLAGTPGLDEEDDAPLAASRGIALEILCPGARHLPVETLACSSADLRRAEQSPLGALRDRSRADRCQARSYASELSPNRIRRIERGFRPSRSRGWYGSRVSRPQG